MAFRTPPPDLAMGTGHHVAGAQRSVFYRVPLGGNFRKCRSQVVFSRNFLPVGADGASAAGCPRFDLRPPFVPLVTAPPDCFVAAGQDLVRPQPAIFARMPLGGQVGITCGQVGLAGAGAGPAAIGAAGVVVCPGGHLRLPDVPLTAAPPHFPLASIANVTGGRAAIPSGVPLPQEVLLPQSQAVLLQALMRTHRPLSILAAASQALL